MESEVNENEIHVAGGLDEKFIEEKHEENEASSEADLAENSLRRSTRVSALQAQKKLKHKEGMVDSQVVQNGVSHTDPLPDLPIKTAAADAETIESPKKKKRKLSGGANLDQYDCAFGIKVDEDGDVVAMTEDSELSSLNEEELRQVRERWEEYKTQLEGMNDEKTRERELQMKELEASLRNEEALLSMLKKTRQKQIVTKTLQSDPKLMSNIPQNSTGAAYKPAMAAPIAAKLNGVAKPTRPTKPQKNGVPVITPSQQAVLQKLIESKQLRPEHIQQLATMAGPQFNAIIQQIAAGQQKQQEQQREREAELAKKAELARKEQERKNAAAAAAAAALEAERQAKLSEQTQQQKINAARNQLRRHLEQHLLQLAPPKAPSNDMSFVPNPSQPDFCYLLGLDLVVQRNLKDKTVFKKVEFEPYVCEECGTDFTPNWKAIAGDKGDLHVYCEQCVRQAQKRKVRNERTSLYKKVFQKIAEQEKEFERQVQAGKFNEASSSTATSSHSNGISTPTSKNTSNFNAAALSGLSGAAKALNQSAASLAAAAGSGASPASLAARSFQNSLRNTMNGSKDLKKPTTTPTTSSSSSANRKRPNSSTNSQMQQLMNAMIQNPQMAQQMQQLNQLSMLRSNPMMLSALMSNPQMLAQLMQRSSNSSSSSSSSSSANQQQQLMQQFLAAQLLAANSSSSSGSQSSTTTSQSNPLQHLLSGNQQQMMRQLSGQQNFMQALQQMTVNRKK